MGLCLLIQALGLNQQARTTWWVPTWCCLESNFNKFLKTLSFKSLEEIARVFYHRVQFNSFQSLSSIRLFVYPMDSNMPDFPVHHQLPELAQTHVHWVSGAIQPSHPLLSPSPPAFNLSQHPRIFSNESVLRIRWPKYWSFSFIISPSNEYSRMISFRIDCFDLPAVQQTLKSLLQHHSSKASILWHSTFFMVQLSHLYMTTGKIVALTRWALVGKIMSLLLICYLDWS